MWLVATYLVGEQDYDAKILIRCFKDCTYAAPEPPPAEIIEQFRGRTCRLRPDAALEAKNPFPKISFPKG